MAVKEQKAAKENLAMPHNSTPSTSPGHSTAAITLALNLLLAPGPSSTARNTEAADPFQQPAITEKLPLAQPDPPSQILNAELFALNTLNFSISDQTLERAKLHSSQIVSAELVLKEILQSGVDEKGQMAVAFRLDQALQHLCKSTPDRTRQIALAKAWLDTAPEDIDTEWAQNIVDTAVPGRMNISHLIFASQGKAGRSFELDIINSPDDQLVSKATSVNYEVVLSISQKEALESDAEEFPETRQVLTLLKTTDPGRSRIIFFDPENRLEDLLNKSDGSLKASIEVKAQASVRRTVNIECPETGETISEERNVMGKPLVERSAFEVNMPDPSREGPPFALINQVTDQQQSQPSEEVRSDSRLLLFSIQELTHDVERAVKESRQRRLTLLEDPIRVQRWLTDNIDQKSPIQITPDGDIAGIEDNTLIVDYFAMWCRGCREKLAEMNTRAKEEGVTVVVISKGDGSRDYRGIEEVAKQYPHLKFAIATVGEFDRRNISALPTVEVYDQQGRRVFRDISPTKEQLDRAISTSQAQQ